MRTVISVALVAALLLAPVKSLDISQLEPVEAIALYRTEDAINIKTDTGTVGTGPNAEFALKALETNTQKVIYLHTAAYLLVEPGAEAWVEALRPYLAPDMLVGTYSGGDVAEETNYQRNHSTMHKLESWKNLELRKINKVEK